MARSGSSRVRGMVLLMALTLLPWSARAQLTQPDGSIIPTCDWIPCLQDLFWELGEALDAFTMASRNPKTFQPAGTITIEVTQEEAFNQNTFGWYNVGDDSFMGSPMLYPLVGCEASEGTVIQKDFATDPNYLGGDIGFFLITPTEQGSEECADLDHIGRVYYSEDNLNTDSLEGTPWIHHIVYRSTRHPQSYYFCFEDWAEGGDNDFNDQVILVKGVKSLCPYGECFSGETCVDGFCVSDCDDMVCDDSRACDPYGQCVDWACYDNPCDEGYTCWNEECIPHPCWETFCEPGQACRDGYCYWTCNGIGCAEGEMCADSACFPDPCWGLNCEDGQVCHEGACITNLCIDVDCRSGRLCNPATGSCEDSQCLLTICPEGLACDVDTGQCALDPVQDCVPTTEICDGVDNDCDGRIDEDYVCEPVTVVEPYEPPPDDGCGCAMSGSTEASLLPLLLLAGLALLRKRS